MPTVSGVPIIGGNIFNFNVGGYIPPSASGTIYNFQYSAYTLNQIWTDDDYVYAACSFGLDIIDKIEEDKIAYIHYNDGFETVWANDDKIYLGTSASGVKYLYKTCISGTVFVPNNLQTCLNDYDSIYGQSSQSIRYIHGSGDDYLMFCTDLGVDVYHMLPTIYRSTTTNSGTRKCFMTSTGKFYYTSVSGSEWSLNRVNTSLTDWVEPDYRYYTGGILPTGLEINDIFITENTASNNTDNTVFIATTSGVYVIDESNLGYASYFTTTVSGGTLAGTSNNFIAMWADPNAGLSTGKIYIASADAFSVVSDTILYDYYTASFGGRAQETLTQPDIKDVNV